MGEVIYCEDLPFGEFNFKVINALDELVTSLFTSIHELKDEIKANESKSVIDTSNENYYYTQFINTQEKYEKLRTIENELRTTLYDCQNQIIQLTSSESNQINKNVFTIIISLERN